MKSNGWQYWLLCLCTLVWLGCDGGKGKEKQATPEEIITKSWKLNKLDMSSDRMDPSIMANSTFTFYKNGRYEINLGEVERGKWSLSPDKKILLSHADGQPGPVEMDILKLEPDLLVLTNNLQTNPMTFEWVPVE
ncbi:MAG TPA: hypothetical protein VHS96_00380 [Bacteroidia bacterium]|nr:hypothetical protein [Bacteroidia bacterium]